MALLLSAADIAAVLPPADAVDVLEEGFRLFGSGMFTMPQRLMVRHRAGVLAAMPAADDTIVGIKVATVHPANPANNLPAVQALVLLHDAVTGELLAILDGTVLTLIRTSAASAVATRHLANPGPASLGVLGSGPLAISHIRAMAAVRPLEEVRIFSPRAKSRWPLLVRSLADLQLNLTPADSAASAVRDASLLVLATSAAAPVIDWTWISPGTHINAVGSHAPTARELDSDTVVHSRIVCDAVEACWAEAGDLIIPEQEGRIAKGHAQVGLGDVLLDRAPGRSAPTDVTVFKSVGLAFQDLWSGFQAWKRGRARGLGAQWDVGGLGRLVGQQLR